MQHSTLGSLRKGCLISIFLSFFSGYSVSAQNSFPADGNAGIGAVTSTSRLNIVSNGMNGLSLSGNDQSYMGPDLYLSRTNSESSVGKSPSIQFGDGATHYTSLIQSYKGQLQFFQWVGADWFESMHINDSGNVGIGTSKPTSTLTVNGNFAVGTGGNNFSYNGSADVNLTFATRGAGGRAMVHDSGNTLTLNYAGDFSGGTNIGKYTFLTESPTGTSYLTGGSVAIGTQNTNGYKLAVNGSVIATSITVKQYPWADYVFKENYNLMSLPALKRYVQLNCHLPEIPSEKEIRENGLNIGELNKLCVKKIEELTLYVIQQNEETKKIKENSESLKISLEARIREQDEKIKSLIARLEAVDKNITSLSPVLP